MDVPLSENPRFLDRWHKTLPRLWTGGVVLTVGLTWWLLVRSSSDVAPTVCTVLLGLSMFFLPGYLARRLIFHGNKWPILAEIPPAVHGLCSVWDRLSCD